MVRLTLLDFIGKAKLIHGDKYDYSKVEYINNREKVIITCPIHGDFLQTPNKHLNGQGCPKCANEKNANKQRKNLEHFIYDARKVHGNKYDYSKTVYINGNTKICIICPKHGEFWQKPSHHLNGHGCPKCADEKNGEKRILTNEEFIKLANEKHHNFYDYSKCIYVRSNKKVIITCLEHGDFILTPNAHLNGQGCPICAKIAMNKKVSKGTEKYIQEAKKKHGNKYDYSKVNYINQSTKIKIICPIHGEFEILPNTHIRSNTGCPMCSSTKLTNEEFIRRAKLVHDDKYDYSKVEYINMRTPVCIICPKHGEFWQQPYFHLQRHGCSKCRTSKLEIQMSLYLKEHNIEYISQYNPEWLGLKKCDFYLPQYNVVIECQGLQHFKKSSGIFNEEKFERTKKSDIIKKRLCEENGVKILYYTNVKVPEDFNLYYVYTDIDELFAKIVG